MDDKQYAEMFGGCTVFKSHSTDFPSTSVITMAIRHNKIKPFIFMSLYLLFFT